MKDHELRELVNELRSVAVKLAEHQANITQVRMLCAGEAHPRWDNSFQTTTTRWRILDLTEGGSEELNTLLAQAREEGRKEAVPEVTEAMALAFHNALSDGSIGQSDVEEIMIGLKAAMLAAAPTPGDKE
jgi:hypothetical protein